MSESATADSPSVDPDDYDFYPGDPVHDWVYEIVPKHGGGVTTTDRLNQMAELVARTRASTDLKLETRMSVGAEILRTHGSMVNELVFETDSLSEEDLSTLENAFDRFVKDWISNPRSLGESAEEYAGELAYIADNAD